MRGDDINLITKDDAIGVIRKCMEVLYYRVLRHSSWWLWYLGCSVIKQVYDWNCVKEWWNRDIEGPELWDRLECWGKSQGLWIASHIDSDEYGSDDEKEGVTKDEDLL